jgi:hypothetical protein
MSAPGDLLVVVRHGTVSESDRAKLEGVGLLVIEVDNPADVRLLRPSAEIESGPLLRCALAALSSGNFASEQRETFAKLVAAETVRGVDRDEH